MGDRDCQGVHSIYMGDVYLSLAVDGVLLLRFILLFPKSRSDVRNA